MLYALNSWHFYRPTHPSDSMSTSPLPLADHTVDLGNRPQSELGGLTHFIGLKAADPTRDILLGATMGDVTIVRLVAEGGMGAVYEGTQGKPQRTVAVKVIRPGVVSTALMKRFEYEAEMLGRLTHPGIAHIYSVGSQDVAGATVPYFVMEFVPNAKSLTAYAESHNLSIQNRITLFRAACDAVAHGHHKGIIHRDLKPSNILVDAVGQPKIIDFGVARSTDADVALTTMHTDAGQLVGTLQYMCPEQFNADSNDIDVRADVYALGMVLWELITGKTPYDIRNKPVFEVARIVREVEPSLPAVANHPHQRDILLIARKCLEKDRDSRYSHASDLVDDLDRCLRGDAVLASAATLLDSVTRLARKHRFAAAALAGVFAAMVLAIVGITSFYVQADRERVWADQQRRKAQQKEADAIKQRQDSEKVLRFLVNTFQLPASQSAGRNVTAFELLKMARGQLESHFGDTLSRDDALVKSHILTALGTSLLGLDAPFDAQSCLSDSLRLLESFAPGDTADKAACMNELGLAMYDTGDYSKARDMLQSALSIKERTLGLGHIETAIGRNNLAMVLNSLGAHEESARLLESARDLAERSLGPSNTEMASILANLAEVRYRQGHYADAETLLTKACLIRQNILGSEHPLYAQCLNQLGGVYRCTGRYAEAAEVHAQARRIESTSLDKSNARVASTLGMLGELHRVQEEYLLARPLLEESLAIREKAGLTDHPDTAVIVHRLALVHAALGNQRESEQYFRRAINVREARLGPSHPDTVRAVTDLARFCRENRDTESANGAGDRVGVTKPKAP